MCPYVLNNCRIFMLVVWDSGLIFNDSQGQVGVDGERGRPGATGQPVSAKKLMMTSTHSSHMSSSLTVRWTTLYVFIIILFNFRGTLDLVANKDLKEPKEIK